MKILFYDFGDIYEPEGGGGGVQRHIHGLALTLVERGHSVRVVNLSGAKQAYPYEVHAAKCTQLAGHLAWCDVAHLHGVRSWRIVAAALSCLLQSKPYVYTFHAYYDRPRPDSSRTLRFAWYHAFMLLKRLWDRTIESGIHAAARATICLTEGWRAYMANRGMPTNRVVVIPNCIRFSDIAVCARKAPEVNRGPRILSVARLDPVKRLEDAIAALGETGLDKAELMIVGKGPDETRLRAVAGKCAVSERVRFLGVQSDEAVAELCAQADVFILPSANEGLPTSLIEAFARRTPVVASDIPGNRAVVDVAGGAPLHAVGNVTGLAQAILLAVRTPQVDEATVARIRRAFSWEARVEEMEEAYRTVRRINPAG